MSIYVDNLKEVPFKVLFLVAREHVRQSAYFPKIAELIQPAQAIMREQRRIARTEQLQIAHQKDQGRIITREEASKLLHDLYLNLAQGKLTREREEASNKIEYATRQKDVAKTVLKKTTQQEEEPCS